MERQPFIITHPFEIARLFGTGYVNAPNGTRWNISFTPGVRGSCRSFLSCLRGGKFCFVEGNKLGWKGFKSGLTHGCNSVKWGWDLEKHKEIVATNWDFSGRICSSSLNGIRNIPNVFYEGCDNISKLFSDAPFGWIPRVLKNIIWNCLSSPVLRFLGAILRLIAAPVIFVVSSLVGTIGRWIIGNAGGIAGVIAACASIILAFIASVIAIICFAIASIFALVGGTVVSGAVALGSSTNRFPKLNDDGSYGLRMVVQPQPSE